MIEGGDKLERLLTLAGPQIKDALREELAVQGFELAQYVKTQKLSGQVLHVQTGTLRRSIAGVPIGDGMQQEIGTNVPYGRYWELGFQGKEAVRDTIRHLKDGREVFVSAHLRNVNQPARPFLRPSLEENRVKIRQALIGSVSKVLKELAA